MPTGAPNNYFNFVSLDERYTTKGVGINAKLGVIAKPAEYIRLGFAIHSRAGIVLLILMRLRCLPTWKTIRSVQRVYTEDSKQFTNGQPSNYKYEFTSPWKFLLSGSYVVREIEDVRKTKGLYHCRYRIHHLFIQPLPQFGRL